MPTSITAIELNNEKKPLKFVIWKEMLADSAAIWEEMLAESTAIWEEALAELKQTFRNFYRKFIL